MCLSEGRNLSAILLKVAQCREDLGPVVRVAILNQLAPTPLPGTSKFCFIMFDVQVWVRKFAETDLNEPGKRTYQLISYLNRVHCEYTCAPATDIHLMRIEKGLKVSFSVRHIGYVSS